MAGKASDEWVSGQVYPGLDPVGHWIHEREGVGDEGRKTGILFRLTDGDLPSFLTAWAAFVDAVIERGGLPAPPGGPDPDISNEELRNSIERPAPFLLPDPD